MIPRLERRVTGASDGRRFGEGREVRKGPEKSGSFHHEGQVKAPPSHAWRGLHRIVPLGAWDQVKRHATSSPSRQSPNLTTHGNRIARGDDRGARSVYAAAARARAPLELTRKRGTSAPGRLR